MQLEVGKIYEGKVTGITKFGAFVEIEPGTTGMVHISEVASTFVKEISDFITQGQMVKVKVMNIAEDGKISLSMKRAVDTPPPAPRSQNRPPRTGGFNNNNSNRGGNGGQSGQNRFDRGSQEYAPRQEGSKSFEDMLSKFMQKSDEKISDLKKATDNRRGSYQKKR